MAAGFRECRKGRLAGTDACYHSLGIWYSHLEGELIWKEACCCVCEEIETGEEEAMNTNKVSGKPGTEGIGKLLRVDGRDHFQNEELHPDSLA
jgi:hypothetical protein